MRLTRKYGEEYRRRIERGLARGLTRQAARGHASPSKSSRPNKPELDPQLEAALRQLRRSRSSLTDVARDAHVSRERLSRYIKAVAGAKRDGKIWRFDDRRVRRFKVVDANLADPVWVRSQGFEGAHLAGLHIEEAGQALKHPKLRDAFRRRWEDVRIRDVDGTWRTLSTDFSQLLRSILTQDYSFEKFYHIEH